jgi:BolA protein
MNTPTMDDIERRLRDALQPTFFALGDDSAMHAGHAGAASGGGHYRVRIVSAGFTGLSRIARHRLVYDPLADLMRHAVHALTIEALTPAEAAETMATGAPLISPDSSR